MPNIADRFCRQTALTCLGLSPFVCIRVAEDINAANALFVQWYMSDKIVVL